MNYDVTPIMAYNTLVDVHSMDSRGEYCQFLMVLNATPRPNGPNVMMRSHKRDFVHKSRSSPKDRKKFQRINVFMFLTSYDVSYFVH